MDREESEDSEAGGQEEEEPAPLNVRELTAGGTKKLQKRWAGAAFPPGALSSAENLRRGMARSGGRPPSLAKVKEAFRGSLLYLLHRDLRSRFPRRSVAASRFGEHVEADMADMGAKVTTILKEQEEKESSSYSQRYLRRQDPCRYFLVVVDAFTRMVFARGLPNKSGDTVATSFRAIVQESRAPMGKITELSTDDGREFRSAAFQNTCEQLDIQLNVAKGEHKARMAERAIRSLKRIIMAAVQSGSWKEKDSWDDLVRQAAANSNARYNRNLGMAPDQVKDHYWSQLKRSWSSRNMERLEEFSRTERRLRQGGDFKEGGKTFRLGQTVLLPLPKKVRLKVRKKEFEMHYDALPWKISAIFHAERPALFKVRNPRNGRSGQRLFYGREIQPVRLPGDIDPGDIEDWRVSANSRFQYKVKRRGWVTV